MAEKGQEFFRIKECYFKMGLVGKMYLISIKSISYLR